MSRGLSLTVLGGAREIGANSYYLDLGDAGLLLDAGMHPKRSGEDALPALDRVQGEVDAIIISHAHLDHVGALPVALQRFPRARIYMTRCTSLLAARMLRNAVAVSRGRREDERPPMYTHDHVEWVTQALSTHELGRPFIMDGVPGGRGPRITLLPAGHILGAAGILVEQQGRRLFYTGDTCATGQYICKRADYPGEPVDLLVLDSTHGADPQPSLSRDRQSFGRATVELGAFIREVVGRGGSVLLPVFALGRAQEILGVLHELVRRGQIPALPLHVSGLAHAIGRIYDATRHDSVRRHRSLCLEELGYRVLHVDEAASPRLLDSPCILVATSGMLMPGTASNLLARQMLPDPRHGVGLVGYLDPETPGYRLARAAPGEAVDLGGEAAPVERACSVAELGFTAHSRASQIVETVRALRPRRTLLVHGDDAAVVRLGQRLAEAGIETQVAEPGAVVAV